MRNVIFPLLTVVGCLVGYYRKERTLSDLWSSKLFKLGLGLGVLVGIAICELTNLIWG